MLRNPKQRKHMKTWITTLAIGALALAAATPRAEAKKHKDYGSKTSYYISGHRSCGTPIYSVRYVAGFDRCGNPVWNTRVVGSPHQYRNAPVRRHYSAPVCPPPRQSHGGYNHGGYRNRGVVIRF